MSNLDTGDAHERRFDGTEREGGRLHVEQARAGAHDQGRARRGQLDDRGDAEELGHVHDHSPGHGHRRSSPGNRHRIDEDWGAVTGYADGGIEKRTVDAERRCGAAAEAQPGTGAVRVEAAAENLEHGEHGLHLPGLGHLILQVLIAPGKDRQ